MSVVKPTSYRISQARRVHRNVALTQAHQQAIDELKQQVPVGTDQWYTKLWGAAGAVSYVNGGACAVLGGSFAIGACASVAFPYAGNAWLAKNCMRIDVPAANLDAMVAAETFFGSGYPLPRTSSNTRLLLFWIEDDGSGGLYFWFGAFDAAGANVAVPSDSYSLQIFGLRPQRW